MLAALGRVAEAGRKTPTATATANMIRRHRQRKAPTGWGRGEAHLDGLLTFALELDRHLCRVLGGCKGEDHLTREGELCGVLTSSMRHPDPLAQCCHHPEPEVDHAARTPDLLLHLRCSMLVRVCFGSSDRLDPEVPERPVDAIARVIIHAALRGKMADHLRCTA